MVAADVAAADVVAAVADATTATTSAPDATLKAAVAVGKPKLVFLFQHAQPALGGLRIFIEAVH